MTVMEYVGKFIELARFVNDYVAMDMVKVRRFEDGLKLPIQGVTRSCRSKVRRTLDQKTKKIKTLQEFCKVEKL